MRAGARIGVGAGAPRVPLSNACGGSASQWPPISAGYQLGGEHSIPHSGVAGIVFQPIRARALQRGVVHDFFEALKCGVSVFSSPSRL